MLRNDQCRCEECLAKEGIWHIAVHKVHGAVVLNENLMLCCTLVVAENAVYAVYSTYRGLCSPGALKGSSK